ncbi:MAG: Rne/Rng family ribonuclease [Acidimicrobiales bacterium]|jgi:ribonuclease E|nr:Rne/Rng family ribonuclease [Acidimicrobiales bacterium]MDP6298953.1 Rne/Rng family ribonuclease [Acidimicrobiales bacterium]HJM27814.1 Rne/Rng family ribonuclease [Acidimicrobiales bacterium]
MEEREESEKSGLNVKQSNKTGDKVDVSKVQDNQTKPKIGDTRPAPDSKKPLPKSNNGGNRRRRKRRRNKSGNNKSNKSVSSVVLDSPVELDAETLKKRRGRERKGKAVGRYTMVVHVDNGITQIATLEGRSLIEFFVSRPSDDVSEIHGNIYMARVENVLPGMEAAFVDIGTPKNAVLYQSDLASTGSDKKNETLRIEEVLKNKATILCQVTKNPIAHKGARLTQEISLAGRFVVLVPNSSTFGISKRLPERERKRLRQILEQAKPDEHGIILRTAAQHITKEEIQQDVARLVEQWKNIEAIASNSKAPNLLYREPEMPFRMIREEFNKEYRSVVVDDITLFEEAKSYLASIAPALAERIEYHDPSIQNVPLFERFYINEQLAKALDSKVWLPSGGSLIIEHTEAMTVVDVNTGKNVGTSSLEETVYRNNLEAAKEVAHQLRLRDIGGIIVIDFVDMEKPKHKEDVINTFRSELARDKTRTQVFGISELGLVEMTRKRIGEGLTQTFLRTQE